VAHLSLPSLHYGHSQHGQSFSYLIWRWTATSSQMEKSVFFYFSIAFYEGWFFKCFGLAVTCWAWQHCQFPLYGL